MSDRVRYDEYAAQNAAREEASRLRHGELKGAQRKVEKNRRARDKRSRAKVLAKRAARAARFFRRSDRP